MAALVLKVKDIETIDEVLDDRTTANNKKQDEKLVGGE